MPCVRDEEFYRNNLGELPYHLGLNYHHITTCKEYLEYLKTESPALHTSVIRSAVTFFTKHFGLPFGFPDYIHYAIYIFYESLQPTKLGIRLYKDPYC